MTFIHCVLFAGDFTVEMVSQGSAHMLSAVPKHKKPCTLRAVVIRKVCNDKEEQ